MSEMDDALVSYLGDRYHEDDWVEPRRLLFSGDGDDAESLRILKLLKVQYLPDPPENPSVCTSAPRPKGCSLSSAVRKSHKRSKVSEYPSSG